MNFNWAIEQLKKGKKVRRKCMNIGYFIKQDNFIGIKKENNLLVESNSNLPPRLQIWDFEADDWELYEDEETKIINNVNEGIKGYIEKFGIKPNTISMNEKTLKRIGDLSFPPKEGLNNSGHIKYIFGLKLKINEYLGNDKVIVFNDDYVTYNGELYKKITCQDIEFNVKTTCEGFKDKDGNFHILCILQESKQKEETLSDKIKSLLNDEDSNNILLNLNYFVDYKDDSLVLKGNENDFIFLKDVKEAVRKLIKDWRVNNNGDSIKAIKEIFGDKLI
jgi:hypothetical protein